VAAAGADSDKWQLNHGGVVEQAEGLLQSLHDTYGMAV
jgi:hypothetical protein